MVTAHMTCVSARRAPCSKPLLELLAQYPEHFEVAVFPGQDKWIDVIINLEGLRKEANDLKNHPDSPASMLLKAVEAEMGDIRDFNVLFLSC